MVRKEIKAIISSTCSSRKLEVMRNTDESLVVTIVEVVVDPSDPACTLSIVVSIEDLKELVANLSQLR
jgi:hypothetical protein